MPQVKIYGLRENIELQRLALSDAIHEALSAAIGTPPSKRFQRFIILEPENFLFPGDRSKNYTIIEIIMFVGRSSASKKNLVHLLYQKISQVTNIKPQDLEITIVETPRENWGIRGISGDELDLKL